MQQDADRVLAQLAQQMEREAGYLLGAGEMLPRPTLGAQREKVQEVEKALQCSAAPGTTTTLGGDASHKRATEQAREAIVMRGVLEVHRLDHPRALDPAGDLDMELHRRHAERLTSWSEVVQGTTVQRCQRVYRRKMLQRQPPLQEKQEQQRQRKELVGKEEVVAPLPNTGYDAFGGDARAAEYSAVVKSVGADASSLSARLRQLAAVSTAGARSANHAGSLQDLWDTVSELTSSVMKTKEPPLTQQAAAAAGCRSLLEDDFRRFLQKDGAVPVQTPQDRWHAAYLKLRSGDVQGCVVELRAAGDVTAAAAAESHWPAVRETKSGTLREVPPPASWKQLLSGDGFEGSGYRVAVLTILSRRASPADVERVFGLLSTTPALRFAQDHVWLHLALASPEGDALYTLRHFASAAFGIPPRELTGGPDQLLYTKVMLWAGCYDAAVRSILSPTALEELRCFALEGLHLSLVLSHYGLLVPYPAVGAQLREEVESYARALARPDPLGALHYLSLLPEQQTVQAFTSICLDPAVCEKLLGTVALDGTADLRNAAVLLWRPHKTAATLCRGAADTAREAGAVLLASQLYTLAVHYILQGQGTSGTLSGSDSGFLSGCVTDLLAFLNPRMTHAIEEMDDASSPLSEASRDILSAARIVFSHLPTLSLAASQSEAQGIRAFEQLYWMAVLCWNVAAKEVTRSWQAFSALGMLPRTSADVTRLVEEVNYRSDASTVREAIHVAIVKFFDLIYHGLSSNHAGNADKMMLIEMARATSMFQSQLRVPPTATTAARIASRRQLLGSLGV